MRFELLLQRRRLGNVGELIEHAAQIAADLGRIDEQGRAPLRRHDGESERHGCVTDVAAADVEQPGDGIEHGQQHRVGLLVLQEGLHLADLVLGAAPGEFARVRRDGRSAQDKISEVQALLKDEKADAVLLTMLDSIAWLFNIRGSDISHTPVALAFAIVPAKGRPALFLDPAKVGGNLRGVLNEFTDIAKPAALEKKLKALGKGKARVCLDPEATPVRFALILAKAGAKFVPWADPCVLPKAIK